MFTKQPMICCICGKEFMTDFTYCGGDVCSTGCKDEFEWRKTLYIIGQKYCERNDKKNG